MVVNSTAEARRVIKDWMYGVLIERGETVASLAEQLGMSRANLHRTCSGTQAPRITTLIEIADGLGYDLDLRFVRREVPLARLKVEGLPKAQTSTVKRGDG